MCDYVFDPKKHDTGTELSVKWSCEHESFENEDFCMFHLKEEQRESHDISTKDITAKIEQNIETGRSELNEYVGATIPKLRFTQNVPAGVRTPVNFMYAEIGEIVADDLRIDQDFSFRNAHIGAINISETIVDALLDFTGAEVTGPLDAKEAEIQRGGLFEEMKIRAPMNFQEFIGEDISFNGSTIEQMADFRGAQFSGRSNEINDNISFIDTTFIDKADFTQVQFGCANFSGCTFGSVARFEDVEFTDNVIFTATFCEETSFTSARFDERALFENAEFQSKADFGGVEFRSVYHGDGYSTTFHGATFDGDAIFRSITSEFIEFTDVAVCGVADFDSSKFSDDMDFSESVFKSRADFDEIQCHGDADFRESEFRSNAVFRGSEFLGGENHAREGAIFDEAVFRSRINFNDALFESASFRRVEVDNVEMDFRKSVFQESLKMEIQVSVEDNPYVDMTESDIGGGFIEIDAGSLIPYDLTNATLGNVQLRGDPIQYELLDYFRFCLTEFQGFNFGNHTDYLTRNSWNIHSFILDDYDDADVEFTSGIIEDTYRKAQSNAESTGNKKASVEFEYKRNRYHREKSKELAFHSTEPLSLGNRLREMISVFENFFMEKTCGYGGKSSRIFILTLFTPVVYGLLYAQGGFFKTTTGSIYSGGLTNAINTIGESMFFSVVTFTTLGYGNNEPISPAAKFLAASEALFGVIIAALLIFTLSTRIDY